MKNSLYNFFISPLEQFENNAIVFSSFQPKVPEEYIYWALNNNYAKMVEYEMPFYFDSNFFSFFSG